MSTLNRSRFTVSESVDTAWWKTSNNSPINLISGETISDPIDPFDGVGAYDGLAAVVVVNACSGFFVAQGYVGMDAVTATHLQANLASLFFDHGDDGSFDRSVAVGIEERTRRERGGIRSGRAPSAAAVEGIVVVGYDCQLESGVGDGPQH
jgi:hypothetical protein